MGDAALHSPFTGAADTPLPLRALMRAGRERLAAGGPDAATSAALSSATTVTALQPSAAYPLVTGTAVAWTATASSDLGPVEYQFWQYRRTYWVMVQDYSPINRWIWTPQAGDVGSPYAVQVWVREVGSTANYEAWRGTSLFAVELAPVPPLIVNVEFPTPPGNQVTWTATFAAGATTPLEYRFRVLDQATNAWSVFRDYEPDRQARWTPSAVGRYIVQVWARSVGSSAEYDLQASTAPFDVASTPVTVKALFANLSFPAATGTSIAWTARAQGGLAGPLQYAFWLNKVGRGWSNPQPYGPSETFTWTPTWGDEGEYWLQVWVRSQGSTAVYEHWRSTSTSFRIQRASLHLTTPTLFPVAPSAPVIWTATVPDSSVALEYQFWVYSATNRWSLGQPYGPSNTFTWVPGAAGSYTIQAWAREVGSTAAYEVYRGTNFLQVANGPAVMVSLTSSVSLPAPAGATITWTAAAGGGTAQLEYQFWRQDGPTWILAQDYSPLNGYTWTTSSASAGQHEVRALVRSVGSAQAFESQMYSGVFWIQPGAPPPPDTVPTAYTAMTNRNAYAEPALPLLGPAGSRFADPVFGSRLLRVTDSDTRPGALARSYNTPSASHQNAWNVSSTYFYVRSTDGTYLPYAFNPATMSATRLQASPTGNGGLTIYSNTEPQFSYASPDILFGTRQDPTNNWPILRQFDFSTGVYTDLVNLGSVAPVSPHTYAGGLTSSAGPVERVLVSFGGSHQDAHYLATVFTPSQGSIVTLDTLASTVTSGGVATATNIPLNFRLHHALIDKSGRYVILETTSPDRIAPRYAAPKYVWDTSTNLFVPLSSGALSGGHYSTGFGTMINQDCCTATSWDAGQWQMRALGAPTATGDLITPVPTPKEVYLADHSSWNNAQPGALVPFVSGFYRYGNNTTPWRAWDDEILAVQTSAGATGATVWRFAHHRSDTANDVSPLNPAFWYEPRPNVSQNGRWAIFTSNWEKTLGTDAAGQWGASYRQDVFLVELAPKP